MFTPRHGQAHTEENDTETGSFHAVHQVLPFVQGVTGVREYLIGVQFDILRECSQGPEAFEITAWFDLYEDISSFSALGLAHVYDHRSTIFTAVGQEHSFGHQTVFCEMSRVAFCGIGTPEHNHVGSVAYLTK